MDEYNALEIKQRIKPAQLTKTGIVIGDRQFTDFIKFSEFIHGETNKYAEKPKGGSGVDSGFKAEKKPIWSGNGIDIYNGDNVGKCINYTQGGLTGKAYGFCIGQPANTMYKSYRDDKASTFYFILDKTRITTNADGTPNLDDDLHVVVFDNTSNGIELTDAKNNTGNIAEFGNDVEGYVEYLRTKLGVPEKIIKKVETKEKEVELMPNRPKDEQEKYEDELLGHSNDSLEWFMALPFRYKRNYIGRGHRLTNDQFDYLLGR
jgi:hypothetical protein